jgi:hypothetical protein
MQSLMCHQNLMKKMAIGLNGLRKVISLFSYYISNWVNWPVAKNHLHFLPFFLL